MITRKLVGEQQIWKSPFWQAAILSPTWCSKFQSKGLTFLGLDISRVYWYYLLSTNSILIHIDSIGVHSLYLFGSFAWGLRMLFMTSQRTRRTTSPIPWNQMQWDLAEKSRRWIDGLWRKRVLAVTQIWNVRRSQKENVEHGGMSQMLTHGCIACEIMRVDFVHGWWSKQ